RLAHERPAHRAAGVSRRGRQPAADGRRYAAADLPAGAAVRRVATGRVERSAQTLRRLDRIRHGLRPGVERAGGYPGAVRPGARALSVLAARAQHESLARERRPRSRAAAVGEPHRHRTHSLHRRDAAVRHEPRRRRAGDDGVPRPDADVQPRQSATAGGGAAREPAPTRYREGSAARPRGRGRNRGFRPRPRGRADVVGTGDFASDRYARNSPENLLFVENAVDWLAQDDALIAIRSKNRAPPPLVFTSAATRRAVKYGNVFGVPLLLVVAGVLRLWRRRQMTRRTYQPLAARCAA